MARHILTDVQIEKLKPKDKRYTVPDTNQPGLYIRVHPSGRKTFTIVSRDPYGKQMWRELDGVFDIKKAREKAKEGIARIKEGLVKKDGPLFEPPPAAPDSFKAVADGYLKSLKKDGARTVDEIQRCLDKYIYPNPKAAPFRDREFQAIKRSEINKLLDHIEEAHGARQADVCLTIIRAMCNWYAIQDDDYVSPIVKKMKRSKAKPRSRILEDHELAVVWKVAEGNGRFGAIVRLALLTAQRLSKIAEMKQADVNMENGIWTVPSEDEREKGNIGKVKLPDVALDIIRAQPKVEGNPYIFVGRGKAHFSGYSASKKLFDEKVLSAMKVAAAQAGEDPEQVKQLSGWTIHDLRRTARSLLSATSVRPDIAERVLGHVRAGVEGTYDRHDYTPEKSEALKELAFKIATIVNPPPSVVVPLRRAKKSRSSGKASAA